MQHPEVDALDQVHDEVLAARRAEVVDDPHHARVTEARQQAGLSLEPLVVVRVGALLECDLDAGLKILCSVDSAHRAG